MECSCGKSFNKAKAISNHRRWCLGLMEGTRQKLSASKTGERNPMWVGDKVKYNALHEWVKTRLPKSPTCEDCREVPSYDLANKGIYDRDLNNWEWLCRRCHMIKDGRMAIFKTQGKLYRDKNLYV